MDLNDLFNIFHQITFLLLLNLKKVEDVLNFSLVNKNIYRNINELIYKKLFINHIFYKSYNKIFVPKKEILEIVLNEKNINKKKNYLINLDKFIYINEQNTELHSYFLTLDKSDYIETEINNGLIMIISETNNNKRIKNLSKNSGQKFSMKFNNIKKFENSRTNNEILYNYYNYDLNLKQSIIKHLKELKINFSDVININIENNFSIIETNEMNNIEKLEITIENNSDLVSVEHFSEEMILKEIQNKNFMEHGEIHENNPKRFYKSNFINRIKFLLHSKKLNSLTINRFIVLEVFLKMLIISSSDYNDNNGYNISKNYYKNIIKNFKFLEIKSTNNYIKTKRKISLEKMNKIIEFVPNLKSLIIKFGSITKNPYINNKLINKILINCNKLKNLSIINKINYGIMGLDYENESDKLVIITEKKKLKIKNLSYNLAVAKNLENLTLNDKDFLIDFSFFNYISNKFEKIKISDLIFIHDENMFINKLNTKNYFKNNISIKKLILNISGNNTSNLIADLLISIKNCKKLIFKTKNSSDEIQYKNKIIYNNIPIENFSFCYINTLLKNLQKLELIDIFLQKSDITDNLKFDKLKTLILKNNNLHFFSDNFFENFPNLQYLSINENNLKIIPISIYKLINLIELDLSNNKLTENKKRNIHQIYNNKNLFLNSYPPSKKNFTQYVNNIKKSNIQDDLKGHINFDSYHNNNSKQIYSDKEFIDKSTIDLKNIFKLECLIKLKKLNLSRNNLIKFPNSIFNLTCLNVLNLSFNKINEIFYTDANNPFENLINLKEFYLRENPLKIFNFPMKCLSNSLIILDLAFVNIFNLTKEIRWLKNLQEFYLQSINLNSIPEEIIELKNLKHITIFDKKILGNNDIILNFLKNFY